MNTEKPLNKLVSEYTGQMDAREYVQKNTLWVLQRFITWMVKARIDVRNPRRADIIHYKNSVISEGKTPTTVNRYLAPVRGFFRWLDDSGIYTNVAAGIKSPKDDRAFRRDYLNPAQIRQLLNSIQTDTIAGLRNYAMVNLMVHMGLRRVEVLRLTIGDLTTANDGYVLNIHRKGRTYKEAIRIEEEVFYPIESYLLNRKHYTNDSPMFTNHSQHTTDKLSAVMVSGIVKRYLKQISNSKKLTCHSLRHSAAINLLNAGRSIYDVRDMLGHRNTQTTEIYLKAIEAERRFSNPAARDLIKLYRNDIKTTNKQRLTI
ncbi:MAG: site-specific integrase [Desulfobulbaceae bacterium]|nr:site-specific integrase [Desulfobulbaceae bacterium]